MNTNNSESKQWVSQISAQLKAPYIICKKNRLSDDQVKIDIPSFKATDETLILIDDLISTGSSMLTIIKHLLWQGYKNIICLAIHPLLNNATKNSLLAAGAQAVVTCNTIQHSTNKINLFQLIADKLKKLIGIT